MGGFFYKLLFKYMLERQGYSPDKQGGPANNSVDNVPQIPLEHLGDYERGFNSVVRVVDYQGIDNGAVVQSHCGADISVPKNEVVESGTIFHHLAEPQKDHWSKPRPRSGYPRGPGSSKAREKMRRVKKQENIISRLNRINI
jgi:hypothetical protein